MARKRFRKTKALAAKRTTSVAKRRAVVKAPARPVLFPDLSHPNARAQRAFLIAYARVGTVTRAATAARVDRATHQNWMKYPGPPGEAYRLAFEQAEAMAADILEDEARRRAVEGLVRYQFDRAGNPLMFPGTKKPYYELEYSDTLLLAQLKANRPDKYRERIEHTGKDGGPIQVEPVVDKLRARLDAHAAAALPAPEAEPQKGGGQ
jgi:hypothetical protein